MSPSHYESLLDRSWRRSGDLLYKTNQREDCCPHYTIRLDSTGFRATKDQRQTLNRFNRHIIGNEYTKEAARRYPKSREEARLRDTKFDLVERIHECEARALPQPPQPAHSFAVTLDSIEFTEEKYRVWENYQRVVHHETGDDVSREAFTRFLCTSPLDRETLKSPEGRERRLGSFHQCYRLDGQLVAIGVIDLLPNCVSAVYFMYHESIHQWSPGKLGALREIALAAEEGYRYWYAGFYIHTCPKMKYKIDFAPQYLLDPDRLEWVQVDKQLLAKFDERGFLRLKDPDTEPPPRTYDDLPMELCDQPDDNPSSEQDSDSDDDSESFFSSNMPGVLSMDQVDSLDLDQYLVHVDRGYLFTGDIPQWNAQSISDTKGLKPVIAELVAAVGADLMRVTCIDFARHS
jgi:arginyl-tRNA---protein transferase